MLKQKWWRHCEKNLTTDISFWYPWESTTLPWWPSLTYHRTKSKCLRLFSPKSKFKLINHHIYLDKKQKLILKGAEMLKPKGWRFFKVSYTIWRDSLELQLQQHSLLRLPLLSCKNRRMNTKNVLTLDENEGASRNLGDLKSFLMYHSKINWLAEKGLSNWQWNKSITEKRQ
jgi:hypothetical protein